MFRLSFAEHLAIVLLLSDVLAKVIYLHVFRHFSHRVMASMSFTRWMPYAEIKKVSGCPSFLCRRILAAFETFKVVEGRMDKSHDIYSHEKYMAFERKMSWSLMYVDFSEYRLLVRIPPRLTEKEVFRPDFAWIPVRS